MDVLQQVHSVAAMLVERHGVRAVSVAEHKALKARNAGDLASAAGWRNVARAAAALMGTDTGLDP
jgi:hypothetical protein